MDHIARSAMGLAYIGTRGWSYRHWKNAFYPGCLSPSLHFAHYAAQFPTVEINLTFYRLPTESLVTDWAAKAPPGFKFVVKGSRFITHLKKLVHLGNSLEQFFERIEPLKPSLGPVLWQLPPNLQCDPERLDHFLTSLPQDYAHAVEFRHPSWLQPEVFEILRMRGVAFVSVSSLRMPPDFTTTAELLYVRFHGLENGAAHNYTAFELAPWADHIKRHTAQGKTAYVYFNNDWDVRAPSNAKLFMEMVGASAAIAVAA